MTRQSISLTEPNNDWLKAQLESKEFTSKSDVVNDLIRRAREIEYIQGKLIRAEQGGFTNLTAAQILAKSKEDMKSNGDI